MLLSVRLSRLVIGASLLLALPTLADAHVPAAALHLALSRSEPAKDSRLAVAPTRVSLWFTATPQLAFTSIRLAGPSGDIPLDRIVAGTGNALHANIPGTLGPGDYRVVWQTASADGHPIRGEIPFSILAPADAAVTTPLVDTSRRTAVSPGRTISDPIRRSEYRSVRWMEFVALLTILGALGFRHGVLPPLASRGVPTTDAADRARRLGQGALFLYALAAIIRLYTESVALHGVDVASDAGVILPLLTETTWGIGWLMGTVGAAVLLLGWLLSKRSVAVGTPLALTGALGIVFAPALSGHAAASEHFILSVTLDVMHVGAAGLWIGGLLMVLIAGIPAMRRLNDGNQDAAIGALVSSFHPLALFCAPVVVAAGLGTSWIRLGGFNAFLTTEYGRTLLLKIGIFTLVLAMGTYNALRARKRLGAPEGTRHFGRTGAIELVLAAAVLAVTTALVASPVPADMAP